MINSFKARIDLDKNNAVDVVKIFRNPALGIHMEANADNRSILVVINTSNNDPEGWDVFDKLNDIRFRIKMGLCPRTVNYDN